MDRRYQNILFQLVEELHSADKMSGEIFKKEKELYERLEKLEVENPELTDKICQIVNLISLLNSDIKYRYYEYGIMAKTVSEITNLEWGGL